MRMLASSNTSTSLLKPKADMARYGKFVKLLAKIMRSKIDCGESIVVITGSSGQLGIAYVESFLKTGLSVLCIDMVKAKGLEDLESEYAGRIFFEFVDITDANELHRVAERYSKDFHICGLVNNAAIDSPPSSTSRDACSIENASDDAWRKVIDVNLTGTYLCCKYFGSVMSKQTILSSIVNISSIYGVVAPDQVLYQYRRDRGEDFYKPAGYSASKGAILNLTRYFGTYWGRSTVRVNALVLSGVFNNQDPDFLELYNSRIPVGRMARVEDFIGPLHFLVSDASAYMTGSILTVDGGWTAI